MTQIQHPQWRDENAIVPYPFGDDATLVNSQGDFLTPGTFIDATFYPIGSTSGLYLSQIVLTHQTCVFWLSDNTGTNLASGTFAFADLLALDSLADVVIPFVDAFGRSAGCLLSNRLGLSIFQTWAIGTHTFTSKQTNFVATVCIPMPAIGVQGLLVDGVLLTGDVWLLGDDGVVLSHETVTRLNPDGTSSEYETIRVDVVGDPLYRRRLCSSPVFFNTPQFIQSINFVRGCDQLIAIPDDQGNLTLTAGSSEAPDSVLRVRPVQTGLVLEVVGQSTIGAS